MVLTLRDRDGDLLAVGDVTVVPSRTDILAQFLGILVVAFLDELHILAHLVIIFHLEREEAFVVNVDENTKHGAHRRLVHGVRGRGNLEWVGRWRGWCQ